MTLGREGNRIVQNFPSFGRGVRSSPPLPTIFLIGWDLTKIRGGQKGADKANGPVLVFLFCGTSDNRIQNQVALSRRTPDILNVVHP